MRLSHEDMRHHRRASDKKQPGNKTIWIIALLFILFIGYVVYTQRAEVLAYLGETSLEESVNTEQSAQPEVSEQASNNLENAQPQPKVEGVSEERVQEMLKAQASQHKKEISVLIKEVRYVGSVMRTLTKSVKELEKSVTSDANQLRGIASRLEKIDTDLQALTEKTGSDITGINSEINNLQQSVTLLQNGSENRKKQLDELEGSLSKLNSRLIDLER